MRELRVGAIFSCRSKRTLPSDEHTDRGSVWSIRRSTDIRNEARRHYASIGLDVADLDARMRCYLIHIGLDHQAYCAFTGQLGDLTRVTERTLSYVE